MSERGSQVNYRCTNYTKEGDEYGKEYCAFYRDGAVCVAHMGCGHKVPADTMVNTDERVQVSVRPFMVHLLVLAEQRMAEFDREGRTMDGATVGGCADRMQDNAIAFSSEYRAQDLVRVTPEGLMRHLADVVNLAGLSAHLYAIEVTGDTDGCEFGTPAPCSYPPPIDLSKLCTSMCDPEAAIPDGDE